MINPKIDAIRLDGGRLTLNFTNTVHDRTKEPLRDYLYTAADLLHWSKKVMAVNKKEWHQMDAWIHSDSATGEVDFSHALILRECIYQIFLAVARRKKPGSEDLAFFNACLSKYSSMLRIDLTRDGFTQGWDFPPYGFEPILARIVSDAQQLLLENKPDKIKECPNCGWLFLDTSKNGKRRWCSMQTCGSAVKSLEYYYRKKQNP